MGASNGPAIRFERDGVVALAVFSRPERLNPLGLEFQHELRDVLDGVRRDDGIRALVLSGEGRGFCVGADLSTLGTARAGDARSVGERTAESMRRELNPLIAQLRELPVPVVSAVNGACAGAGVGIALAADVVIAARSAYFYLPFLPRLGIVPDLGTTWFMDRLIGRARAMGLALLGDRLPAEQAQQWGLIWACVDDTELRQRALDIAHRLAALPSHAAIEARRAMDAASLNTLAAQLEYEAGRQRELLDKPSFAEGVAAFRDKREPRFGGRR